MRVRAFAKINLRLQVVGVRADGYHELRTIFQSIALHDTLTFERTRGALVLSCDDPACPAGDRNLVWRAAEAVWRAAGRRGAPRGVRVKLVKRIPMQAGLGGGSSDAAAAIRALGRMWRVDETVQRDLARQLGADVPYFLEGGTVLGLDRGDSLYPLFDRPASWVVLSIPPFGVSTADAFAWFDREWRTRGNRVRSRRTDAAANDLEPVVAAHHPEVTRLVRALRHAGATLAAMSGSGSAVFGLFDRRRDAVAAVRSLGAHLGGRRILTRTIDRDTYRRLACK